MPYLVKHVVRQLEFLWKPTFSNFSYFFFARFHCVDASKNIMQTQQGAPSSVLMLNPYDIRQALDHINTSKATGSDGVSELTVVFTDLFNTSLEQGTAQTCLKSATIIPVPKQAAMVMKCLEWLLFCHTSKAIFHPLWINTSLPTVWL